MLRCCAGLVVLLGARHPDGALTGGWDDPAAAEERRAGLFSSRERTPRAARTLASSGPCCGCRSCINAHEEKQFFVLCTQYLFMCLTNLIRRVVFMTSDELAIPGGLFMAGGGPVGGLGGVKPCDSIVGKKGVTFSHGCYFRRRSQVSRPNG